MSLNQNLFRILAVPPGLDDARLTALLVLAEWAILIGPASLVLLWVFGVHQERRAAVAAGLAALLALLVAHGVSSVVMMPRPFVTLGTANILHHAPDSSFPSDHATLLFGLAFALALFRPARVPRLWLALVVLALAVGGARVALGVHYPLDIAGAAAIAAASAGLVASRWGCALARGLTRLGERLYGIVVRPAAGSL